MLGRAAMLRRAIVSASRSQAPRRFFAEEAVTTAGNKLKFNFFLPHDTIKKNVEVVSTFFFFILFFACILLLH